ncbi:ABC transporter ATP-binding protein [Luteimonas kalidii]|uniref:ABC transporter ATP-binding protein n=1 Tax=Luteimonas kalidii TaxID=3042025 RepID=A0ABT6JXK0_9GAMM|nr:ABC transporter ATP-binding protein [Luteimonas kalidii]MDH5835433.1 ABC transporter ATP-binding protein [Luteimonas kalidii]
MTAFIRAEGVTLDVPYYEQPMRRGKNWAGTLLSAATAVPKRQFARLLDDVSFEIREGERVILLGRNGAGKTTLLRVLTGAFQPTVGSLQLNGSRQALLNLGLGFNQEATVHENIFLRATAMGIDSAKIRDVVESILDFAELGNISNRRLLTLSSGQRMRLGFAISTVVQHDIMLLDEWFGAGDFGFMRKARERLVDRVRGSKIVVVASHNMELARRLCTSGIVMEGGKIAFSGPVADAIQFYRKQVEASGKLQVELAVATAQAIAARAEQ